MTTDAARKAVFNTPELLENIISFVPSTDILTKVQRLSRQWKDAVESSPVVKNKLWMKCVNATVVQPTYINDEHSNPTNSYWATLGITVYSSTVTFNPLLDKNVRGSLNISLDMTLQPQSLKKSNGELLGLKVVDFVHRKASGGSDCAATKLRSSWRNMYLTNPPITTALLCASNHDDAEEEFGPYVIKLMVRDHDGLTLGLLHDTLVASLPSAVRAKWRSTERHSIGSLYTAMD